jgi:hypothetical protein
MKYLLRALVLSHLIISYSLINKQSRLIDEKINE